MGRVIAQASVSLDGFIAGPDVRLDLVPVVLGAGTRMLDGLGEAPIDFAEPEVVAGAGVTHLIYQRLGS